MLYIDAWLDRPKPYIRIIDRDSGDVITQFEGEEVTECLERGDICVHDLYCNTPRAQHEMVKHLLLTRCSKSLVEPLNSHSHHSTAHYQQKTKAFNALSARILPILLIPVTEDSAVLNHIS
ncbi:hypothetical protein [Thiofilum flexile]|uniref:hypothetical protein n=1 Tax=Thiofilum flexile TaxID=125627 RepID=UPI0013A54041|nr:hypothetical protein [Thiofilum flexile]